MTMTIKRDITGRKFGRLLAIEFVPSPGKFSKFLFRCDCGTEKLILAQSVISGATVSCGCYSKEASAARSRVHGHGGKRHTKTYKSWAGMMSRSEWGSHPSYSRYGANGIHVCDRWHDFRNFLEDMGERPPGTSIDRINGHLGYFKGNCRWASRKQQNLNTTRTIRISYNGRSVTADELCEELGVSKKALRSRAFRRGGDYTAAFESLGIDAKQVFPAGDQRQGRWTETAEEYDEARQA